MREHEYRKAVQRKGVMEGLGKRRMDHGMLDMYQERKRVTIRGGPNQELAERGFQPVSAEKRFFHQAREIITSYSRDAWQEIIRLIEAYSDRSLTKKAFLNLLRVFFLIEIYV